MKQFAIAREGSTLASDIASDFRPAAWVRRVHGVCRISLAVGGVLALLAAAYGAF
jgi:hypothetical protein